MRIHQVSSVLDLKNVLLLKITFKYMFYLLQCPYFEDILPCVLPTCLLMIDDHELKNKVLGLECLAHLANNVVSFILRYIVFYSKV